MSENKDEAFAKACQEIEKLQLENRKLREDWLEASDAIDGQLFINKKRGGGGPRTILSYKVFVDDNAPSRPRGGAAGSEDQRSGSRTREGYWF